MVKKICESLKSTAVIRRSCVGHIFGIPVTSSELTSLVCHVQEKLAEEAINSIHSNSTVEATKMVQNADFDVEHKKLKQKYHDTKRELDHLKQLCARKSD